MTLLVACIFRDNYLDGTQLSVIFLERTVSPVLSTPQLPVVLNLGLRSPELPSMAV